MMIYVYRNYLLILWYYISYNAYVELDKYPSDDLLVVTANGYSSTAIGVFIVFYLSFVIMLAVYILTMCIMCDIMMFYSQLEHEDETFKEVSAAVG